MKTWLKQLFCSHCCAEKYDTNPYCKKHGTYDYTQVERRVRCADCGKDWRWVSAW